MKIGILGLGSIGQRHAKNLLKLGHEVIAYDPESSWHEYGVHRKPRDIVLHEAEALVIASPTVHHKQDLIDTGETGKPTFAEKPLHENIGSIHDRYHHVLMVGYNLRFHHVTLKVKEWLDQGRIGHPVWAQFWCAQKNEKPVYRRDGVILNWSHEIDLAMHLLGRARCDAASYNELETIADIILLHRLGKRSTVHLDYVTDPEQRGFSIIGTEGYISATLAPERGASWHSTTSQRFEVFTARDSYDENYVDEMKAFIDRIEGKETIGATCQEGQDVVEVCLDAKYGVFSV